MEIHGGDRVNSDAKVKSCHHAGTLGRHHAIYLLPTRIERENIVQNRRRNFNQPVPTERALRAVDAPVPCGAVIRDGARRHERIAR